MSLDTLPQALPVGPPPQHPFPSIGLSPPGSQVPLSAHEKQQARHGAPGDMRRRSVSSPGTDHASHAAEHTSGFCDVLFPRTLDRPGLAHCSVLAAHQAASTTAPCNILASCPLPTTSAAQLNPTTAAASHGWSPTKLQERPWSRSMRSLETAAHTSSNTQSNSLGGMCVFVCAMHSDV